MVLEKTSYSSLELEYSDPDSLSYKKIRLVNSYIPGGGNYLDIGMGTGELITLRIGKHEKIFGIDPDEVSLTICQKKFDQYNDVNLIKASIGDIQYIFNGRFDCITCLDVLEHINEIAVSSALQNIYKSLNEAGIFIFSGPGIYEKIRIFLGQSPTHLHSHSSYGWKKYIKRAGFSIINVESVEFPLIHSEFLRKNIHLFGKCCVIVAQKKNIC